MPTVSTATIWKSVKETLKEIITDDTDGMEKKAEFPKYFTVDTMKDIYVDDLEIAGPGLASEVAEGVSLPVGDIKEGTLVRYIARKLGLRLDITEEADLATKYPKVLDAAKKLKAAMWRTYDVDAANVLNRASNAAYVGGDGQPLASNAHTLPGGGTYSNTLATPVAPSRAGLITMISNIRTLPGHHGIRVGYKAKAILCPVEQWAAWGGILGSTLSPDNTATGQTNEINVIKPLGLDLIPVTHWTASQTKWGVLTDADDGLKWLWWRKLRSRSWVDEDTETMKFGVSSLHARGWSNPRCFYFSDVA